MYTENYDDQSGKFHDHDPNTFNFIDFKLNVHRLTIKKMHQKFGKWMEAHLQAK